MSKITYIEPSAINAFSNLLNLIDNAEKYISISTWIFTKNDVSTIIMDHLQNKISNGVEGSL